MMVDPLEGNRMTVDPWEESRTMVDPWEESRTMVGPWEGLSEGSTSLAGPLVRNMSPEGLLEWNSS